MGLQIDTELLAAASSLAPINFPEQRRWRATSTCPGGRHEGDERDWIGADGDAKISRRDSRWTPLPARAWSKRYLGLTARRVGPYKPQIPEIFTAARLPDEGAQEIYENGPRCHDFPGGSPSNGSDSGRWRLSRSQGKIP